MSVKNLDKIFHPKSIAVIGASNTKGSVGYLLLRNLIGVGYEGTVYPVNKSSPSIQGIHAYSSISQIPQKIDLALIAVPAQIVPDVLRECADAGIGGAIVVSAGFKEVGEEGKQLEEEIWNIVREAGIRLIGPNCLGIICPRTHLNASFAHRMPEPGNIAFISQSGALCTAILDWCAQRHIGFSAFVSIGSMVDVDFSDLIDYFGMDPYTQSIILYMESLSNAREFMSAARHFARSKPIIVVKSGRFSQSAQAAASHTGALAGDDDVYNAMFQRAGIIRVSEITELFNCSAALASQARPRGLHLAVVTNAGGPGVIAADKLLEKGGKLATLSQESVEALNKVLPSFWSHSNPVDILGDATPERYRDTLSVLLQDKNIDGILVLLTPQAMTQPDAVATVVNQFARSNQGKPILASWMGEESVAEGRKILNLSGIPTFDTPEEAVETYLYMYQYTRNIAALYEMPEDILEGFTPDRNRVKELFRQVAKEDRKLLAADESQSVLQAYGIPTVQTLTATSLEECVRCAEEIGYPVVVKILSPEITHKTDAGGVMLNLKNSEEVRSAYEQILENVARHSPEVTILGATVQAMISGAGYEVFIGSKYDPLFGPVVVFGAGGTLVEFVRDRSLGLPPLTQALARRMIEDTRIFQLLKGFRDRPAADLRLLEQTIVKVSSLLVDFPELVEMDINPVYLDDHSLMALDARILIDPAKVRLFRPPGKHLIISHYPTKYNREWVSDKGDRICFRVIRPEDEPLWIDMLKSFSAETIRYRFFAPLSHIDHHTVIRYCHIDYDREIAIVAETMEDGKRKMIGVGRLIREPEEGVGEFAVVVTDRWQGKGVGSQLLDILFEVANDFRLRRIVGDVLADNTRMLTLCRQKGFRIQRGVEPDLRRVVLDL